MRVGLKLLGAIAAVSALAGCSTVGLAAERPPQAVSANAAGWSSSDGHRTQSAPVSVITGSGSDRLTARFARKIFNTAPVVVVSAPAGAALRSAADAARAA